MYLFVPECTYERCQQRPQEGIRSPRKLEFQVDVSHTVFVQNWTQVFWTRNQCLTTEPSLQPLQASSFKIVPGTFTAFLLWAWTSYLDGFAPFNISLFSWRLCPVGGIIPFEWIKTLLFLQGSPPHLSRGMQELRMDPAMALVLALSLTVPKLTVPDSPLRLHRSFWTSAWISSLKEEGITHAPNHL